MLEDRVWSQTVETWDHCHWWLPSELPPVAPLQPSNALSDFEMWHQVVPTSEGSGGGTSFPRGLVSRGTSLGDAHQSPANPAA